MRFGRLTMALVAYLLVVAEVVAAVEWLKCSTNQRLYPIASPHLNRKMERLSAMEWPLETDMFRLWEGDVIQLFCDIQLSTQLSNYVWHMLKLVAPLLHVLYNTLHVAHNSLCVTYTNQVFNFDNFGRKSWDIGWKDRWNRQINANELLLMCIAAMNTMFCDWQKFLTKMQVFDLLKTENK